jgi:hypothetical protein
LFSLLLSATVALQTYLATVSCPRLLIIHGHSTIHCKRVRCFEATVAANNYKDC